MWTLYDMGSGEIIATSRGPQEPAARPLPLYAPGAATGLFPLAVAAVQSPRALPREVVLASGTCQTTQPSRRVKGSGSSASPPQGPRTH